MKTILITGSSRGIGRAAAELAHKQGYKVIVHGHAESPQLDEIHKKLEGSTKVAFDIADKKAVHDALKGMDIDILVNNAGMGRAGIQDIADIDDDQALLEYKTNVLGTLHVIQAVLPGMLKKETGAIVSVCS